MIIRRNSKYRDAILKSNFFDRNFFRNNMKLRRNTDEVSYYLNNWKKLTADPSPYFDTKFYLDQNPDVRDSNFPPLVHYLLYGWKEGRSPSPLFDRRAFIEAHRSIDTDTTDAAATCLTLYGGFEWPPRSPAPPSQAAATTAKTCDHEGASDACRLFFDADFYTSHYPDIAHAQVDPFSHYMEYGFKEDRDPSPSFDTFFYKRRYLSGQENANPLKHYATFGLRHGYSTAPENSILFECNSSRAYAGDRICVHAHCFYPEVIGEVVAGLQNFPNGTHFIATVCSAADGNFIEKYLEKNIPYLSRDVIVVPNRGRDLGPFFVGCAAIWQEYDLVVHIHTKKSPHISWGEGWRTYLYNNLMGSKDIVNAIVEAFSLDQEIGILYPQNYFLIRRHILSNKNDFGVRNAAKFLGIHNPNVDSVEFPAGSMFWCRPKALRRLATRLSHWEIFDEENNQVDGTFAHALERLIAEVARHDGFSVKSYKITRQHSLTALPAPRRDVPDSRVTSAWPRDTPLAAVHDVKALAPLSTAFNASSLDIHWIIPSFIKGSGGHMTIFRIVKFLEEFGHRQTIWLQNAKEFPDPLTAKRSIVEWYTPISEDVTVLFLPEDMNQLSGDVLIATDCWTAFPASQATRFKERFYFVQDMESEFHPAGSNRLVADSTYDLGFSALCAGRWLEKKMLERGLWTRQWDLCADQAVYFPLPKGRQQDDIQIALYARSYTPRRAVEIAVAGLTVLAKRGLRFKVHLFGEDTLPSNLDFPHESHGVLTHGELAQLYRKCDIGVVFSATNYSLIPLEMAACGLPVVELDVESTRAVFTNDEVTFAKPTPRGVADAIESLIGSPQKRQDQRTRALDFISARSWEKSARAVESAFVERLQALGFRPIDPAKVFSPATMRRPTASVFIPTFNAGASFRQVLDRLTSQRCDFDYDILIIDSGSTDETQDIVRSYRNAGVRLEEIPKRDFQHGRTRNLGIAQTSGDYVAILTQDAVPKNDSWLANLIAGFGKGSKVAGVTGRHQAYPEHGPFVARDMEEHFDTLAIMPDVIDADTGLPSFYYPGSISWRMLAYFYSDNNSAIARAAWKELPYPEIDWGEDYVWASLMIKAGFQKAYVDNAVVLHSHDFDRERLFRTAMEEGAFWKREFGVTLVENERETIKALQTKDTAYAIASGIPRSALRKRLRSNEALVLGRKEGARSCIM